MAVECKWSEASLGELRGLGAFVGAYPDADAVVVVPALAREYTLAVRRGAATVIALPGLIRRLAVLAPSGTDSFRGPLAAAP